GVVIHEVATGLERRVLPTDQALISAVAFNSDGRMLATAGVDGTVLVWDLLAPPPGQKEPGDVNLEALWTDLGTEDGARVERAVLRLAAIPKQSVPFLRKQVKAGEKPDDQEQYDKLIADLDGESFEARKRADTELARLGIKAKPALQRALRNDPS